MAFETCIGHLHLYGSCGGFKLISITDQDADYAQVNTVPRIDEGMIITNIITFNTSHTFAGAFSSQSYSSAYLLIGITSQLRQSLFLSRPKTT